ncbi:SNF2-related protein [Bacillus spizizenii]|nr:SNF2-related protein [Bacillus spizizenii]
MQLRKVNIGNGPYANANIVCHDPSTSQIVFMSAIGYDGTIKSITKEINRRNSVFVERMGNFGTTYKAYEIVKTKDQESDYAHAVIYKKDEVTTDRSGAESLNAYMYTELADDFHLTDCIYNNTEIPEQMLNKLYDKLYEHTPVPLLPEWMDFVTRALVSNGAIRELRCFKPEDTQFKVFKINIKFSTLFEIVSSGLSNQAININGTSSISPEMTDITGLDSYLNGFTGILADQIQRSFVPKFTPGTDSYSERLQDFDDYATYKGLKMYDAQKAVVQATSNNLDTSPVSFIIGEMGIGKTILGIASVFTNLKKEASTNVILCPSHLVEKWKAELEKYMPLSTAVIVDNFDHFKAIENEINNPRRRRHMFMIMSKETAKFGYEERPSAVWSSSKKCYTCPECGEKLYKIEYEGKGRFRREKKVYLTERDFVKQYAHNKVCMGHKKVWDEETRSWEEAPCGTKLWTPLIKEDNSDWVKLSGGQGWIEVRHIPNLFSDLAAKDKLDRKDSKFLMALNDAMASAQDGESRISRAPRKYPIAKYIKKYYKGKIDYLLADEMHLYKGGSSDQGAAFGDLINAANKTIGLTGTLLNGYANGLFYILFRTFSHLMKKEGFDFNDEQEFARQFGVVRNTSRFAMENGRQSNRINSKEKILPGVSPLVFTKFLLENAAFISLSDIADGMPGYQEIPVPVQMDTDLSEAYNRFEEELRQSVSFNGSGGSKALGSFLQGLSVYPDQCYDQPPVIHPDTGEVLVRPPQLEPGSRNKEDRFLEIVKEKVEAGEKVLVYYNWTNRTDLSERLPNLLKEEGIKAAVLTSSTVSSKNREEWINKKVDEGLDVLICNPALVETGLDLLSFTTILFYQVGYNLFTMRQASRRSWRLSQTKDIEVYFMYYENTIQEQALSLMATKLQASQAIEGKFSEEGLHAMSNNEDLLTQIANSVVEGIRHTVDVDVFGKAKEEPIDIMYDPVEETQEGETAVEEVFEKPASKFTMYTIYSSGKKSKRKKSRAATNRTHSLMQDIFHKKQHVGNLY